MLALKRLPEKHTLIKLKNVPWWIWKWGLDRENSRTYLSYGKTIVKIGPVDAEIYLVDLKKEEITEGKIYSPVGKFAERAK